MNRRNELTKKQKQEKYDRECAAFAPFAMAALQRGTAKRRHNAKMRQLLCEYAYGATT